MAIVETDYLRAANLLNRSVPEPLSHLLKTPCLSKCHPFRATSIRSLSHVRGKAEPRLAYCIVYLIVLTLLD